MSTGDLLALLTVVLAVVVVLVLAAALIVVRRAARAHLRGPRDARLRARGRRGRAPAPARGLGQGDQRAVRHHPRRAARASRARPRSWPRGGRNDALVDRRHRRCSSSSSRSCVYLLNGVLSAARSIVPSVERIASAAAAGSKDLDATALAAHDAGSGGQDGRGSRRVRRLARRDHRRRELGEPCSSHPSNPGRGHDRRRRPDRPRARLLPRLDDRAAAQDHGRPGRGHRQRRRDHREERAGQRRRQRHQREARRRRRPARGPARAEGRAGGRPRPRRGPLRRRRPRPGSGTSPRAARPGRRASARSTPRARSRSRGSAARPRSPWPIRPARCCATSRAGSLAARLLYPDVRHTSPPELPRSPVIGTDAPVQYEQRDDIGAPRRRLPDRQAGRERAQPNLNPERPETSYS